MSIAPYRTLGVLLSVTVALVAVVGVRLSQRGQWYPQLPGDVGAWTVAESPLPSSAVEMLGSPRTRGRAYTNPFGEKIEVHLITTPHFESYKEPTILMARYGCTLTGEKQINLFGKENPVRALILRNDTDGLRVLMYYWVQNRSGRTESRGSVRSSNGAFPRVAHGVKSTMTGAENCIVRVYTQVHPADKQGRQARRNINEVSQAIYKELKEQGAKPGNGV